MAPESVPPSRSKTSGHFDLSLTVRDCSLETLRATLKRLAERYDISAILPPFGISQDCRRIGEMIATLSDQLHLPSFLHSAYRIASNRYLTRCVWQNKGLPTMPFSLIQFPSALAGAIATIGFPARITPLHYDLPHLSTRILRETDIPYSYALLANTLQRHTITHSAESMSNGEDPRTHHHIRFSLGSDMLAAADPPATPVEAAVLTRSGVAHVLACTPIARRGRITQPALSRRCLVETGDLATAACQAVGIQTGLATCLLQRTVNGTFLDGIIPNAVDPRLIPAIEAGSKKPWSEIILGTYCASYF